MKIIVTGGAGFIGSHLTEALLKKGEEVWIVDNFNSYYNPKFKRENIKHLLNKKNLKIIEEDILEKDVLEKLLAKHQFDKIVHLAASVGVRNSIISPDLYARNNIEGTKRMLMLAHKFNIKHFIFASSSSVYGKKSPRPFKENNVVVSKLNPYAASKKAAEELCEEFHKKYGISITVFRFFTVYGPKGRPDMAPYIFTESILKEDPIRIYGDGSSQRDFTYIQDLVNGILAGIEKSLPYEVFNLGSSSPIDLLSFIGIIEDITEKKAKIKFEKIFSPEMKNTFANIQKAEKLLGYKPKTDIKEGMESFIKWYKKNRM